MFNIIEVVKYRLSMLRFIAFYKYFILSLSFLFSFFLLSAQNEKSRISIKTYSLKKDNKVYLRWFLGDAQQWRIGNQKGYIIERAELGTNDFKRLNNVPIKPLTEKVALEYGKKSDVYALYSILNKKPDISKSKDLEADEQVYPLFIFLTIYNPIHPVLTASGYVDSTIRADKAYTYRVTIADLPIQNQTFSPTSVPIENSSQPLLPDIQANFGDKMVQLSWNIKPVMDAYLAIVLERSTDSILYSPISKTPLISSLVNSEEVVIDSSKKIMSYKDEELQNRIKYYYRIKGINIFGLYSEPGNVVSGECMPDFKTLPRILSVDTLASRFIVTWQVVDSLQSLVKNYELWSSETADDTTFTQVVDVLFEKSGDKFQFAFKYAPKETNYFKIKAILKKDNSVAESLPYLYQMIDSVPPAVPRGLQAEIDSVGNVSLQWLKNTEEDIKGYKIYKSLTGIGLESFTAITGQPVFENEFKEKVEVKQLNRNIYYRITALDNKYNESALSDYILVIRPDIIPPSVPLLKEVSGKNNDKSIQIRWAKSVSKDVKQYSIYRKNAEDTTSKSWQEIATVSNNDTVFLDNNIATFTSYSYRIQAIDSSNLKSGFTKSMDFIATKQPLKIRTITNLNSYVSRDKKYIELNWNVPNQDILEVVIYRVENRQENQIIMLATVPASTKIYDDENIRENTIYTYYLKPVFKNGKSAEFVKIDVVY